MHIIHSIQLLEPLLRQRSRHMRNRVVRPFAFARDDVDVFPLARLQNPFVRWSADVAASEEVWPDEIDGFCWKEEREGLERRALA